MHLVDISEFSSHDICDVLKLYLRQVKFLALKFTIKQSKNIICGLLMFATHIFFIDIGHVNIFPIINVQIKECIKYMYNLKTHDSKNSFSITQLKEIKYHYTLQRAPVCPSPVVAHSSTQWSFLTMLIPPSLFLIVLIPVVYS